MERDLRLLGLVAGLRAFGYFLFQPFLALYLHNVLGLDFAVVGTLLTVYLLPALFLGPVGGLLADRMGRRRLLLLSLLGEAGGILLLAEAMTGTSLLAISLAAILGFLFGTIGGPANSAYVADLVGGSERTKGFTWLRVGFNAGAGAGVALGGFLVGTVGFAGVTAAASLFMVGACVLVGAFLGASPYDVALHDQRPVAAVPDGPGRAAPPSAPRASMAASLRVLGRDRTFLEACLAFGLAALVGGQWGVAFPLYANTTLGIPYGLLGLGISLNAVIVVVGQAPMTHALVGRRHTRIGQAGVILYVAAWLALGLSGEWMALPVVAFVGSVVVSTVGENLVAIPQTTLASNLAPAAELGNYNGAFQVVGNAGFLLAVFFGGLVLGAVSDPLLQWVLMAAPAVPCLLLLRHVARRIPEAADRA